MVKNGVVCIEDFLSKNWRKTNPKLIPKGMRLHLIDGKIYDKDLNWVCDLYTSEGLAHFKTVDEHVKQKQSELKELSQGLLDWLYKNGTSHTTIVISLSGIVVSEDRIGVPFEIRD